MPDKVAWNEIASTCTLLMRLRLKVAALQRAEAMLRAEVQEQQLSPRWVDPRPVDAKRYAAVFRDIDGGLRKIEPVAHPTQATIRDLLLDLRRLEGDAQCIAADWLRVLPGEAQAE